MYVLNCLYYGYFIFRGIYCIATLNPALQGLLAQDCSHLLVPWDFVLGALITTDLNLKIIWDCWRAVDALSKHKLHSSGLTSFFSYVINVLPCVRVL